METIRCPYCDCKVKVSDVETDDGTCPECGAPLLGSTLFDTADTADDDPFAEEHEDNVLEYEDEEDDSLDT